MANEDVQFYFDRANYYDAVSFADSIFRVLRYLNNNYDEIPEYEQILVDEYQDFNKLVVFFLDLLAKKSGILIVGDDDQALYGNMRTASPKYMRDKYYGSEYRNYDLPYCSRCTKVIVRSMKDVVSQAQSIGKLKSRIDKEFKCFTPGKREDSENYPKIIHAHCTVQKSSIPYISRFIDEQLSSLSAKQINKAKQEADFTALVAAPTRPPYLDQIETYFQEKGYYQVFTKSNNTSDMPPVLDGYEKLLKQGRKTNLGWRILLKCRSIDETPDIIKKAGNDNSIFSFLPEEFKDKHLFLLDSYEKIKNEKELSKVERQVFEEELDITPAEVDGVIRPEDEEGKEGDKIDIMVTTYVGCKGLSGGFVFLTGLNNGTVPNNPASPLNIEIRNFIVALTRTVKRCYLISNSFFGGSRQGKSSVFIDWINDKRIDYQYVDKDYWR